MATPSDNMTQKVEPFFEDFNDGNSTGWTNSAWMDFSNGYATSATAANIFKNTPDADFELTFDYLHTDVPSSAKSFTVHLRFQSY